MNKLFILLVGVVAINGAMAQSCLPEGIEFTTQEQIDNFQTNYPGCTEIEGSVKIGDAEGTNITNLNGLSVITSLGYNLQILWNDYLTSLSGLENITSIGGKLDIYDNDALTHISALESLISIGGNCIIESNAALTGLSGLGNLLSVGGDLSIVGNGALTSLSGLENITSLGGNLNIISNYAITSLAGLENFTSLNGLVISFNTVLSSLAGLENLAIVGGHLYITGNNSLTNLAGLENLTSISGDLSITLDPLLTNLSGLGNVKSVGGILDIVSNGNLTNLSGLDNIEANSIADLYIYSNPNLSECDIQSICEYLAAPNGIIYIQNNAPGCNSVAEVEEHCLTGTEENQSSVLSIIPNPGKDWITVAVPSIGNNLIEMFNTSGEKVIKKQLTETETQIDISALPRGVYFVRVQDEKAVQVAKFVKE
jgi:hypothetical protein